MMSFKVILFQIFLLFIFCCKSEESNSQKILIRNVFIDELSCGNIKEGLCDKDNLRKIIVKALKELKFKNLSFELTQNSTSYLRFRFNSESCLNLSLNLECLDRCQLSLIENFELFSEICSQISEQSISSSSKTLLTSLLEQYDLSLQGYEQLMELLKSDASREKKIVAIKTLGLKKEKRALATLLSLAAENDSISLNAIGAIVDIGEEESVKELIKLTYQRGPFFIRQIIYAVSSIGGKTARAYLFNVANGHLNPVLRKSALEALLELNDDEMKTKVSNPM